MWNKTKIEEVIHTGDDFSSHTHHRAQVLSIQLYAYTLHTWAPHFNISTTKCK